MTLPDLINGTFEFGTAVAIGFNIRGILRDRAVKGVRPPLFVFVTAWGFWNLFYYPHLDQWLSFAGGCAVVLVNATYLSLMLYFIRFPGART